VPIAVERLGDLPQGPLLIEQHGEEQPDHARLIVVNHELAGLGGGAPIAKRGAAVWEESPPCRLQLAPHGAFLDLGPFVLRKGRHLRLL